MEGLVELSVSVTQSLSLPNQHCKYCQNCLSDHLATSLLCSPFNFWAFLYCPWPASAQRFFISAFISYINYWCFFIRNFLRGQIKTILIWDRIILQSLNRRYLNQSLGSDREEKFAGKKKIQSLNLVIAIWRLLIKLCWFSALYQI